MIWQGRGKLGLIIALTLFMFSCEEPSEIGLELDPDKNKVGLFFSELISCMLCTSTWVGFLLSLTMFSPSGSIYSISLPFSIFFDGMYSAGIVWSINAIIEWFENK